MAYALEQSEAVDISVRRIAMEELSAALDRLHGDPADQDERIHDIRKSLKKLRALARLVRDELGKSTFARENACFRDLGRQLSSARDAAASIESFDKLLTHYELEVSEFGELKAALGERRNESDVHGIDESLIDRTEQGLRLAAARVSGWPLERSSWAALGAGFRRTYAQGRDAIRLAYAEPTHEHFHDWRKRVKDHLYHLRLLSDLWREPLKGRRLALEELAEILGDDHDLVELRRVLGEEITTAEAQRGELLRLLEQRQHELRSRARFLGERIYAERAKALVSRMGAYYEAWRAEVALPSIDEPIEPDGIQANRSMIA